MSQFKHYDKVRNIGTNSPEYTVIGTYGEFVWVISGKREWPESYHCCDLIHNTVWMVNGGNA